MAASDRYRWKENISSYRDWILSLCLMKKKCFHIFERVSHIFFLRTPLSLINILLLRAIYITTTPSPPPCQFFVLSLVKFNRVLILNIASSLSLLSSLFKKHWKSFPYRRCEIPHPPFSWATFLFSHIYIKLEKMRIFLVIFIHFFGIASTHSIE